MRTKPKVICKEEEKGPESSLVERLQQWSPGAQVVGEASS